MQGLHGSALSSVTTPRTLQMEVADISNVAHLPDQMSEAK
jgi:hypothetical protein